MAFTRYYSGIDLRGNGLRNLVLTAKTGDAKRGMLGWSDELGPVYYGADGGTEIPLDAKIALGLTGTLEAFVQNIVNGKTLESFAGYTNLATKAYVDSEIGDLNSRLSNIETGGIARAEMGVAGGVATLDPVTGKVPNSQLPSYVDDVLEAANFASLPTKGESGKIYVTIDNGNVYRWTGSTYLRINDSVSTSETATKLATARSITLDGDVSGTADFDGSANIIINTTSKLTVDPAGPLSLVGRSLVLNLNPNDFEVNAGELNLIKKVQKGSFDFSADENGLVQKTISVNDLIEEAGMVESIKYWVFRVEDAAGNTVFFDVKQTDVSVIITGEGCSANENFRLYWKI